MGGTWFFEVAAGKMHDNGHVCCLSADGVWLTDTVPAAYLAPLFDTPKE